MEDNSDFETVRSYYARKSDDMARQYAEYCGGSEDDFLALSTFEQFLWFELYINPLKYTTKGQYDTYFSDLGRFQATITERCYSLLSRTGDNGQEIADAYQEIMAWQYNLFAEHGFMYSFMTDEISIEINATSID
ncbi:hypothetical protein LJB77_01825 [Ruminococcaceae bacterium OttesenSCG-928-N02]|nr:hypothetical protein [Ruminococcaceae bacterium OttesenSCG-928-N02]